MSESSRIHIVFKCTWDILQDTLHVCVLSCFSSIRLFAKLWTVACQAPLSKGFSGQEYWSELPHPPPGNLPNPGIEITLPATPSLQADSLQLRQQRSLIHYTIGHKASLSKFQKIKVISSIFSSHNTVRLEINFKGKKIQNTGRMNNTQQNKQQIAEELKGK